MEDVIDRTNDGLFSHALGGIALALPLWAFVFRGRRGNFWMRMAFGAGSLGLYSLRARPELRRQLPGQNDLMAGILSAAGLYSVFQIGDRLARRIMPRGEQDIASVYAFRT